MYKLADGTNSTDYKIGDRFEVVVDDTLGFTKGSLVELCCYDRTRQPIFKLVSGNSHYNFADGEIWGFALWEDLKPHTIDECVGQDVQSNTKEAINTLQSLIAWPEITLEVSDDCVMICVFDRKFSTLGEDVEAMLETINMLVGQEVPQ